MEQEFYNPKTGLVNAQTIYNNLKDKTKITLQDVKNYVKKQEVTQIHKPYPTRKHVYFPITAIKNEIMKIDLADMSNIESVNRGYKWLLCCVDVMTRKAYVYPMKQKNIKCILLFKPLRLIFFFRFHFCGICCEQRHYIAT